MTDLTESDNKLLTEFLGECWLENDDNEDDFEMCFDEDGICPKCGECAEYHQGNRSFTTPYDQHAVFKKLVEVGKWEKFYIAMRNNFCKDYITVCSRDLMEADFNVYLFINPERFCKLVSEYLKGEVKC